MGTFVNLLFFGISFIALAISGGFATNGAVKITHISGYKQNKDLDSAHKYLSWAAVICWITIALILVLGVVYLLYGDLETAGMFTNIVIYGLLLLSLGATIIVGIFSAIAAQKIAKSKVSNDNNSRRQAIIAAVLAIVTAVGLIAGLIAMFFTPSKKKDDKGSTNLEDLALLA